jgi:hypothetical protein
MPIDFAALFDDEASPCAPGLYRFDDIKFRGKTIRRTTVDLTPEVRRTMDGRTVYAVSDRGARISVIFAGQRGEDFAHGLGHKITEDYQALTLGDQFRAADAIRQRVIVEGVWKKRSWKDRDGAWHEGWDLLAARWSYKQMSRGKEVIVEEGQLPA